jgi:hypothetical protein
MLVRASIVHILNRFSTLLLLLAVGLHSHSQVWCSGDLSFHDHDGALLEQVKLGPNITLAWEK